FPDCATLHPGYTVISSVIASHRVGAQRRPMPGSAKQSIARRAEMWIASSLSLLATTIGGSNHPSLFARIALSN
ncbi:hypothetical protein, partial [Klebsiella aerogenes]|uniref:hypothetical protein n=1 Tax=Klebsiella aerogenes TaxID=548 RepID=UPI00195383DE